MRILIIEPYYAGSHAAWVDGYKANSRHEVRSLTLPGRFWKWRMHGAAVTLARAFRAMNWMPDLLLSTDMLDLTTFLALTRDLTHRLPVVVYFHENQLTYPWSETDRDMQRGRNLSYSFINYVSAMTADVVLFNSSFHRESFLEALPRLLKHFPDFNELDTVDLVCQKSRVLPLGLDLRRLDKYRPTEADESPVEAPIILWNHRWEYDKNPEGFFTMLDALSQRSVPFRVVLLGESFRQQPAEFDAAMRRLGDRVAHAGYVNGVSEYAEWLWRADLLPVTAFQEFFGASVVEAVYCGAFPLLPQRLSYPGLIPRRYHEQCLYKDKEDLVEKAAAYLTASPRPQTPGVREAMRQYDWSIQASVYDELFAEVGASFR
jgi:glycosyltransferase involved in cell wall biosynthesis